MMPILLNFLFIVIIVSRFNLKQVENDGTKDVKAMVSLSI